jgi:hypothetical protein
MAYPRSPAKTVKPPMDAENDLLASTEVYPRLSAFIGG